MAISVRVSVKRHGPQSDVSELSLVAADGRRWSKRYHGNLFLLFDAQELDLVEMASAEESGGQARHAALKTEAPVDEEKLRKLRFDVTSLERGTS